MSEAKLCHRLDGLEPDNLLAFLALLGLLRSLELSRPDLKPRIFWDFRNSPLRPVIRFSQPISSHDLCSSSIHGLKLFREALRVFRFQVKEEKKGGFKFSKRTGLPTRAILLRSWTIHSLKATLCGEEEDRRRIWKLRCDILACFASELSSGKNEVEQTPLKLPSGQMAFIGAMFDLAEGCQADDLSRSLFSSWQYDYKGNSLRLSPDEAQRYAYRASDPSPEGAFTEKGASALSGLGMLSFPMVRQQKAWRIPGYEGTRRDGKIHWPLWNGTESDGCFIRGASLSAIEGMLRAMSPDPKAAFRFLGKNTLIATAKRYILDPTQGDYGNISRAEIQPLASMTERE